MLSIEIKGVDSVLKEIKDLTKPLEKKIRELAERLLNEGYGIAVVGFTEAKYAGKKDVEVDLPVWEGDTLILRAHGDSVAFIEFGTGTHYERYPDPSLLTKIGAVDRGQYDKKKGEHPPWVYLGDAGDLGEIISYKRCTMQAKS